MQTSNQETPVVKSINPFNGEEIASHKMDTKTQVQEKIDRADHAFRTWRKVPVKNRAELMARAGQILEDKYSELARMITLEMGKPISEAEAEIKKCAWVCRYYAEHAEAFLADEQIETDAGKSFVRNEPMGCILAVMPWNYPFWQVFRYAAPTLTAGNTGLLKHASNVWGCAKRIKEVFDLAGFPEGVFDNLFVHHDEIDGIIADPKIKAVTLTGSERAGSSVAESAGRNIKKSLLELGGSNAFVVLEDADLDQTIATAVTARMQNAGQSCIAAKRFILVGDIYDRFTERFTEAVKELRSGDPIDENTRIGPLARKDLADELHSQIERSVEMGARIILGGKQDGSYHEPTILVDVKPGMPAFNEETFGPLAVMVKASTPEQAIELAENNRFGLGVTVCTSDIDKALELSDHVSDGAFFVNELVKSDPRLPFGGTKKSGYGRELSRDGMLEFVNRKTIYIK